MNPDDIARVLDELGQRLGPAGSYVFELAVRQVYIDALFGIVVIASFVAAMIVLWRKVKQSRSDYNFEAALVATLTAIGALGVLYMNVLPVLNPEYAALTDILSRIVP